MSIVLQDSFGRQYSFDNPIKIGSDSSNQIVLLDSSISPFHASFSLQGNSIQLQVLSSENETFVNQKKITGSKNVNPGDSVFLGKVGFTIVETGTVEAISIPVPQIQEEKPAKPNRTGLFVVLAVILAVCVIGLAGGIYLYQNNPDLQEFVSSLIGKASGGSSASTDGEGPAVLSLNDPALNTVFTSSFIQHVEDIQEGVDKNGKPLTIRIVQDAMEQSTPDWSDYSHYVVQKNSNTEKDSEFSIVKGMVYSKSGSVCKAFSDTDQGNHSPSDWPKTFLRSYVNGKAKKAESGITINGVLTDRYEITKDNSAFANKIDEIVTGELYRAQKGGYLVQLKIVQKWPGENWPGSENINLPKKNRLRSHIMPPLPIIQLEN